MIKGADFFTNLWYNTNQIGIQLKQVLEKTPSYHISLEKEYESLEVLLCLKEFQISIE